MEKQKVKDEIAARFSKKNWLVKALPIAYCAIGVLLMTVVPVYADDIFATAKNAMQTVYTDVAGIATVAAVVCAAVCLFLMNFSKSGLVKKDCYLLGGTYDIGCDCNVSGKDYSTEHVYGMI